MLLVYAGAYNEDLKCEHKRPEVATFSVLTLYKQ
jgi:hypothetical protein